MRLVRKLATNVYIYVVWKIIGNGFYTHNEACSWPACLLCTIKTVYKLHKYDATISGGFCLLFSVVPMRPKDSSMLGKHSTYKLCSQVAVWIIATEIERVMK